MSAAELKTLATNPSFCAAIKIADVVENTQGVYEGDLRHYFGYLWFEATNLDASYHNLRHLLHVTRLLYIACMYHADELSPRERRNLMVAGIMHDFNHSGRCVPGRDDLEIMRAIRALEAIVSEEDRIQLTSINLLMWATQFPHKTSIEETLPVKIIRDADVSQTFSDAWLQQVVIGLSREWGRTPFEVLAMQEGFLRSLKMKSGWGQFSFPAGIVEEKVTEAKRLFTMLTKWKDETALTTK